MTAHEIIELLGGVQAVSAHTGWPYTTVKAWVTYNQIPDWRQSTLLDMAREKSVALSTADFPSPTERVAKRAAA